MRYAAVACMAGLLTATTGCYEHHVLGEDRADGSRGRDAGARDAGRIDAGRADAGVDAGPLPLPREPEPDPGPDGRPSDGPTDDWEPPPSIDEDDDCCVLGEIVGLPSPLPEASGARHEPPPVVGWGQGEWGVAFTYTLIEEAGGTPRLAFYRVARDGAPLGEASQIDSAPLTAPALAVPQDVHWAAGRWAVPVAGDQHDDGLREAHVHLIDAVGRPAARLGVGDGFDGAIDAAYLAHGDRWLGLAADSEGVHVRELDEVRGPGAPTRLPVGSPTWLRAEGLVSRVALAMGEGDGLRAGRVELVLIGAGSAVLASVELAPSAMHDAALARLRDHVVLAIEDGEQVHTQVVDPFELAAVSDRSVLGTGRIGAVDAAGSDKFGVAGVCWTRAREGERPEAHDLLFRLVGPDGRLRGRAVTVNESTERNGLFRGVAANCAVGSDDLGFLVVWASGGTNLWVRRIDVR